MKYYFDLIGWVNSSPIHDERIAGNFFIDITKYSDLNGNIIEEWGSKKFDKAVFTLREHMLKSERFLFLFDRENTPHNVRFGDMREFSILHDTYAYNCDILDALTKDIARWDDTVKILVRQIYPVEDGIRFTYYVINKLSININSAIRQHIINNLLTEI